MVETRERWLCGSLEIVFSFRTVGCVKHIVELLFLGHPLHQGALWKASFVAKALFVYRNAGSSGHWRMAESSFSLSFLSLFDGLMTTPIAVRKEHEGMVGLIGKLCVYASERLRRETGLYVYRGSSRI